MVEVYEADNKVLRLCQLLLRPGHDIVTANTGHNTYHLVTT